MTTYHLIIDDDLRQEINALSAEYKRDPNSAAGKEYVGVINGLKALQSGREDAYEGKQLGRIRRRSRGSGWGGSGGCLSGICTG